MTPKLYGWEATGNFLDTDFEIFGSTIYATLRSVADLIENICLVETSSVKSVEYVEH
ncbi:MAG: hypothetical protein KDC72_08655 [Bacteroidetes bacterium]|nr:hypothetical protein [Bacteroidota bacterium]